MDERWQLRRLQTMTVAVTDGSVRCLRVRARTSPQGASARKGGDTCPGAPPMCVVSRPARSTSSTPLHPPRVGSTTLLFRRHRSSRGAPVRPRTSRCHSAKDKSCFLAISRIASSAGSVRPFPASAKPSITVHQGLSCSTISANRTNRRYASASCTITRALP